MGVEIERKFLVSGRPWEARQGVRIRQGYLCLDPDRTVRVRMKGDEAFLTIKGRARGLVCSEFEYPIPAADGESLLALCGTARVEKIRYEIPHAGHTWEVDVFEAGNAGLVVAEIELADEAEAFERPDWAGPEVSGDPRYLNANLARSPFGAWAAE